MKKVKLLYHNNYWDGPLSGVCEVEGLRYYFDCKHHEHDDPINLRIYAVYELSLEEWQEEDYWHKLFEQYVGTHTNYDDQKRTGVVKSQDTHHIFYDLAKQNKRREWLKDGREPVGFFDRQECCLRPTLFRDYFVDGDSFTTLHEDHCALFDIVEWSSKAQFFAFDKNEDGVLPGWSIAHDDQGTRYPLGITYCPRCGKKLPSDLKDIFSAHEAQSK